MPPQGDKPRVFISHAWEDKPMVQRIEAALQAADVEVWTDHKGIRGGDNLPAQISKALEWCNTLLLIWSRGASQSTWVEAEWTSAKSLGKTVIPCILDEAPLPGLLSSTAYISFQSAEQGIEQLLQTLGIDGQLRLSSIRNSAPERFSAIHSPFIGSAVPSNFELYQASLGTLSKNQLSDDDVKRIIREKNFFDTFMNPTGQGQFHQYKVKKQRGKKFVIDLASGLIWQQSGSPHTLLFRYAGIYLLGLNEERHCDYDDWRLPTLDEAMSLMEAKKHGYMHIASVFDKKQRYILTSNEESNDKVWVVDFKHGCCRPFPIDSVIGGDGYIRAVRRM